MGGRHVAGGGAGPRGGESKAEREQLEQQGGASRGGAALTAAKVTRPKLSQQIFPVSLQKYAPAHPGVLVAFFLGTIFMFLIKKRILALLITTNNKDKFTLGGNISANFGK